jgi:hypothetical protein
MKKLSVPRGLEHKLAKEFLATVKAEIKTRDARSPRPPRKPAYQDPRRNTKTKKRVNENEQRLAGYGDNVLI